jgi:hypothetical protein
MRIINLILSACFFLGVLPLSGCDSAFNQISAGSSRTRDALEVYDLYAVKKISILPLTEFVNSPGAEGASNLRVYVALLDKFDSQIRNPAVFRFEIYEHMQRSAEQKGKRIVIWPDIDLTDSFENNNYWHDFLRAYEFNLDFQPQSNRIYVLQVTCITPTGKRLSGESVLRYTD